MNISECIFLNNLTQMKEILGIGEFKFGKSSDEYRYFKKQVMDAFYNNLRECFKNLETDNVIERCECKANLRHGYSKCSKCHGAGYVNKQVKA